MHSHPYCAHEAGTALRRWVRCVLTGLTNSAHAGGDVQGGLEGGGKGAAGGTGEDRRCSGRRYEDVVNGVFLAAVRAC